MRRGRAARAAGGRTQARTLPAALLAALLALAFAGCGGRPPGPPSLVLVTLDTFRQDHLGCTGEPRVRTPHLDRLARRGTLWRDAVTAIPLTTPSHATILTGLGPRTHGLLRNRVRLDPAHVTVAERLKEAGYRTGAIVSSRIVLGREFGLDRGFDTYDVVEPARLPASGQGAEAAARAVSWLRARRDAPDFLWVHFFDAHLPYLPPAPWSSVYGAPGNAPALHTGTASDSLGPAALADLRARYAGEVSFLDRCVGEIARAVESRGDPGGAVLVVTADHGEGLGEHETYFGHDVLLYESTLRVPLILARIGDRATAPGGEGASSTIRLSVEPARTVDLAPTLEGLAGLAPDPASEGHDLLGTRATMAADRRLFAETHPDPDKAAPLFAVRTEDAKVVWKPRLERREYYDLRTDPAERNDLGESAGEALRALAADLMTDLQERPPGTALTIDEERGGPDETVRKALESLGYVGGR